jgi:transposase InsO family protein
VLNVIDDYSRECLACIVDTSLSVQRVVRELAAIAERRGLPCMVVSDNGTELTNYALFGLARTPRPNGITSPRKALLSLSKAGRRCVAGLSNRRRDGFLPTS